MNIESSNTPQPIDPTKAQLTPEQKVHRLKGAATDFEGLLIHQMMQDMEKTLDKGNLVGGDLSGNVYSGILTAAVAKSMAEHQSMGLADQIYKNVLNHEPDLKKFVEQHPELGHCVTTPKKLVHRGDLECLQPPAISPENPPGADKLIKPLKPLMDPSSNP